MRQRTIVCPLIQNDGAYLLCKMADDRGVFPGQWAISGGGVEPGERIEEALRREIREELGEQLLLTEITPWTFSEPGLHLLLSQRRVRLNHRWSVPARR